MSGEKMPDLAADSALLLKGAGIDARLLYILPGPNAFGAGLLSRSDASFSDTIAGIESGEIKALLLVEADPFSSFPDLERWIEALKKLELFIVLDYLPTLSVERAHAFLPTATVFETDSYWLNHEGRLQKASYVHRAGSPINQVSGGDHPPRHFLDRIPGGDLKPCHDALAELGSALSRHEEIPFYQDLWTWLANENPIFSNPLPLNAGDPGIRLIPDRAEKEDFPLLGKSITLEDQPKGESFELLLVDWTFGTEELSAYSTHTRGVEKLPLLMMQEEDAARLHLIGGDKVLLRLPGGALEVELWTGRNMAHGVIVMPRHRQLAWQKAGAISRKISVNDIERI
jgi:NADH-quinone oxidoreductase subunit G